MPIVQLDAAKTFVVCLLPLRFCRSSLIRALGKVDSDLDDANDADDAGDDDDDDAKASKHASV